MWDCFRAFLPVLFLYFLSSVNHGDWHFYSAPHAPTIKKLPTALYWHHWTYSTTPRNMIFVRILFVLIYMNLTLCRNSIQFIFFLVMRLNIIIVTEGASFIIILAWNVSSKNIWIIKLVLIFNIFLKYVILPLFYKEVVWNSFPL